MWVELKAEKAKPHDLWTFLLCGLSITDLGKRCGWHTVMCRVLHCLVDWFGLLLGNRVYQVSAGLNTDCLTCRVADLQRLWPLLTSDSHSVLSLSLSLIIKYGSPLLWCKIYLRFSFSYAAQFIIYLQFCIILIVVRSFCAPARSTAATISNCCKWRLPMIDTYFECNVNPETDTSDTINRFWRTISTRILLRDFNVWEWWWLKIHSLLRPLRAAVMMLVLPDGWHWYSLLTVHMVQRVLFVYR